jgi:HEAT repeat protein
LLKEHPNKPFSIKVDVATKFGLYSPRMPQVGYYRQSWSSKDFEGLKVKLTCEKGTMKVISIEWLDEKEKTSEKQTTTSKEKESIVQTEEGKQDYVGPKIPFNIPSEVRKQIERLYSSDPVERGHAAYMLGEMGKQAVPAIPYLIGILYDGTTLKWAYSRYDPGGFPTSPGKEAAKALVKIGKPAVEPLIAALKNENWAIRAGAVKVLDEIKDTRAVEPLSALLKDENSSVREVAANTLFEWVMHKWVAHRDINDITKDIIKNTRSVEFLIIALKDENSTIQWYAANILGKIKDKKVVGPLIEALSDNSGVGGRVVSWAAADALVEIGKPSIEPLIVAIKKNDKDFGFRQSAGRVLIKIRDSGVVDPLILALKDEDPYVRSCVAEALGEIKDIRAVQPLIIALKDEDPRVRRQAVEALGGIKDSRAVEPLIAVLKAIDPQDSHVNWLAVEALGVIKDSRAVEPLIGLLMERNWFVQIFAREALEKIDPSWPNSEAAKRAVPVLINVLKDKDWNVRNNAAEALKKITGRDFHHE